MERLWLAWHVMLGHCRSLEHERIATIIWLLCGLPYRIEPNRWQWPDKSPDNPEK